MHIAQINVARLLAPIDDPKIARFVDLLDEINALGEQSDGFVWRLKNESGSAVNDRAFDDSMIIANMSVWESVELLRAYTYYSGHVEVYRDRAMWFAPPVEAHMALWQISEGHTPTLEEGIERLEHLRAFGPTERAFTFKTAAQYTDDISGL